MAMKIIVRATIKELRYLERQLNKPMQITLTVAQAKKLIKELEAVL